MSLTTVQDDFTKWVKKVMNPNNMQGALARIYPVYQKLQTERFMTENASEGSQWKPLSESYKKYKLKRYGGGAKRPTKKNPATTWKTWPGNGTKMLIGTSTLAGAAIGPSDNNPFDHSGIQAHQALFTQSSMVITINSSGFNAEGKKFVYPQFVNLKRPFMTFSQNSMDVMKQALAEFILPGGA